MTSRLPAPSSLPLSEASESQFNSRLQPPQVTAKGIKREIPQPGTTTRLKARAGPKARADPPSAAAQSDTKRKPLSEQTGKPSGLPPPGTYRSSVQGQSLAKVCLLLLIFGLM